MKKEINPTENLDGWYFGLIRDIKKGYRPFFIAEIYEFMKGMGYTDIDTEFINIDDAIRYFQTIVDDLKAQKKHKISFKWDGENLNRVEDD